MAGSTLTLTGEQPPIVDRGRATSDPGSNRFAAVADAAHDPVDPVNPNPAEPEDLPPPEPVEEPDDERGRDRERPRRFAARTRRSVCPTPTEACALMTRDTCRLHDDAAALV